MEIGVINVNLPVTDSSCSMQWKRLCAVCHPTPDYSMPGFPVLHHLLEFKFMFIELVMPSNHLILCCRLLLLPSIFPQIRVFSSESVFPIRWPKHWSVSFNPSNEYSVCIFFFIFVSIVVYHRILNISLCHTTGPVVYPVFI